MWRFRHILLYLDRVTYESSTWRQRLHTIVFEADTRAGRAFDVAVIVCIVTSVVVVVLESISWIGQTWHRDLFFLEISFTILFTIEYALRLAAVKRPLAYARSFLGIIDLLAIAPTWLSLIFPGAQLFLTVRVIRLLRIFRILKLTEYLSEAGVITAALRASRRKISVFLFAVMALVVLIGVGYGDLSPQTSLGKFLASMVMILGFAIIAVPPGIVTSELTAERRRAYSRQACPSCGREGHDEDAAHCKFCGSRL